MNFNKEELIQDLIERTRKNLNAGERFNQLTLDELNFRNDPQSWSILECLEHLNRYGDFYLPEIDKRMKKSQKAPDPIFYSGWLGNYFAKSMLPKEPLNKMNTFKKMNPIQSNLDKDCIDRFVSQQQQMLELLDIARSKNLTAIKTGITISNWIKLRLGDTFRVVIYHNDRHIVQAKKLIQHDPELVAV